MRSMNFYVCGIIDRIKTLKTFESTYNSLYTVDHALNASIQLRYENFHTFLCEMCMTKIYTFKARWHGRERERQREIIYCGTWNELTVDVLGVVFSFESAPGPAIVT